MPYSAATAVSRSKSGGPSAGGGSVSVCAYHRATEAMMTHILADAREHPVMAPYHAHWQRASDIIAAAWRARGRRRTLLRAGIALALSFDTWRTLAREQELTDDQALELMFRLTCDCSQRFDVKLVARGSREDGMPARNRPEFRSSVRFWARRPRDSPAQRHFGSAELRID